MDVEELKTKFPQFEANNELVYLDTAATSLTPQVVIDALNDYYKSYRANVHRGLYKEAEKATKKYEEARKAVIDFIGAKEGEVVFCAGATHASNMLFTSLGETHNYLEGNEIVTTTLEHHAMLLPIQRLAKEKGMKVYRAPYHDDYTLDRQELEKHINTRTKIVALTLASNVLGSVSSDVRSIVEKAHKVGAVVVLDGTAAVGHMKVDMFSLGADYMFFSGHKMCGPTGIGVLYGKRKLLKDLEPAMLGGGMVDDVTEEGAEWREAPERFEAGTQHIAGAIALQEAIFYIEHIGFENIESHCRALTKYAIDKLEGLEGVRVFAAPPEHNIGIVSFTVDGAHPHDVAQIAGKDNVAVRAGHHCALPLHKKLGVQSTTRASFYIYNTESDIDKLVDAVRKTKEMLGK
jgi:cysteine desulfurase/selenocysteine lyase